MKFQVVRIDIATIALVTMTTSVMADPAQDLEECRNISVESERLACFDAAYDQLRAAGMTPDSVLKANVVEIKVPVNVATEESAKSGTKAPGRKFLGFGLPSILRRGAEEPGDFGLKSGGVERNEYGGVEQIAANITEVSEDPRGNVTVRLANGQRWRQTDGGHVRAKPGDLVVVRRAALGSYLMNIGKNRAVRATRIDDGSNATDSTSIVVDAPAAEADVKPEKKGGIFSRIGRRIGLGKSAPTEEKAATTPAASPAATASVTQSVSMVMVDPTNNFIITLEDGQVWQQISGFLKISDGDSVTITPDTNGGYLLKVDNQGAEVPVQSVY